MNPNLRFRTALLALAATGLTVPGGCVWRTHHTVETTSKIEAHIVLDVRQVKDEAAAVEDYVRGDSDTPPPAPGSKPTSAVETNWGTALAAALDLTPSAHAAVPVAYNSAPLFDVNAGFYAVSAEDEKAAIERRRQRAGEVEQGLDSKQLGENNRGYLTVLDGERWSSLAKAENADRQVIYQAIADRKAGGARGQVEPLMAETIREKLSSGQMFEVPKDKAAYERFKASSLGKQYPDAKQGDWLTKR